MSVVQLLIYIVFGVASLTYAETQILEKGKTLENKHSFQQLSYSVKHSADGNKYPLPISESYILGKNGSIKYHAYFYNMPTSMNHVDTITWKAGKESEAVITEILRHLPDLKFRGDNEPSLGLNVYTVTVEMNNTDTTRYVKNQKTNAWININDAFQKLIVKFEKETGRPKNPFKLPQ